MFRQLWSYMTGTDDKIENDAELSHFITAELARHSLKESFNVLFIALLIKLSPSIHQFFLGDGEKIEESIFHCEKEEIFFSNRACDAEQHKKMANVLQQFFPGMIKRIEIDSQFANARIVLDKKKCLENLFPCALGLKATPPKSEKVDLPKTVKTSYFIDYKSDATSRKI